MKKTLAIIIPILVVVAVAFYFIFGNSNSSATSAANTQTDSTTGTENPNAAVATSSVPAGSSPDNTSTASGGGYTDGSYTGSVANAVYGQLQVTVTIQGGQITDVTYPVYPNSPGHTSQVSAMALPELEQEAIASQSANVNIVSGATQDSEAFQQSLASALAQAKG